ncbi:MAG: GrpB family protein [Candidatus Thorarchaeota archaeon]
MSDQIEVIEFDENWFLKFDKEKSILENILGSLILQIEHIGSTAIQGLAAKPIIDIMIGVESLEKANECIPYLEKLGYEYIPEHENELPNRRFFRKPPRGSTKRDFHIHIVVLGSSFWRKQLFFRDYLRSNINARIDYGNLKKELAIKYHDNRYEYTNAKTEFILNILSQANDKFED